MELWQRTYSNGTLIDNATINGHEYLVLRRDTSTGVYQYLVTSKGEELQEDENGYVGIEIMHCEIEDAMPVLETMVIKTQ